MDNEFGIVGYSKKTKNINKTNYIILTEIFVNTFVLTVISGFFSIIIGINIYTSIFFLYILFYIKCYYYNDNAKKNKRFTNSKTILSICLFQK